MTVVSSLPMVPFGSATYPGLVSVTETPKPNTPSSDYLWMSPYWRMTSTILLGADAMRRSGETYLPRFPNEDSDDYEYRRKTAVFTNIYRDILENLSTKPFTREVQVRENSASDRILGRVVQQGSNSV